MTLRGPYLPIGVKLIGIVSIILIASLAGMTLWTTNQYTNDVQRTVKYNTLDRADLISQKVASDLQALINAGRLIATSVDGGLMYRSSNASITNDLIKLEPDMISLWVLSQDSSGLHLVNRIDNKEKILRTQLTMPDPLQVIAQAPESFKQAFAGASVLDNLSPLFNYPVLALAFPYQQKTTTEAADIAVLLFSMDGLIHSLEAKELYVNTLVDATGKLLVSVDQKLVVQSPRLTSNPLVREAVTSSVDQEQLRYTETSGQKAIGSFRKFFGGRLIVLSSAPEDKALAQVNQIRNANFGLTAIVLWVAMMLLFFYSRTLSTPIRRLVDGTVKIQSGVYDIQFRKAPNDEIGRLSLAFTEMSRGLAERERIKTAFGKFVNKEIAEKVMRDDVRLGGEMLKAAIFFSDIRSFTAISEKLTPHEVVEFLNRYMTAMVECVNRTQGVVDKYIGDAIMAVWGVPYSRGNDTENAINGALMMRRALKEFNQDRGTDSKPFIRIGMSVNTGEVVAGQIGSPERMEYTVIGDPVNLASRIEALNKPFHTDILISEFAYQEVQGIFRVVPMKKIMVKGKAEPQQVYAVLGRLDDQLCPTDISVLRQDLGLEEVNVESVNTESEEVKYEVLE